MGIFENVEMTGKMEYWNIGILESWNLGRMEGWNLGRIHSVIDKSKKFFRIPL